MIRHIVLWRLKAAPSDPRRGEILARIKAALEAQNGRIPGLLRAEAGLNFATSRRAVDFAFCSEFVDREALAAYHRHPAHMETRAIVDPLVAEHWVADFEA